MQRTSKLASVRSYWLQQEFPNASRYNLQRSLISHTLTLDCFFFIMPPLIPRALSAIKSRTKQSIIELQSNYPLTCFMLKSLAGSTDGHSPVLYVWALESVTKPQTIAQSASAAKNFVIFRYFPANFRTKFQLLRTVTTTAVCHYAKTTGTSFSIFDLFSLRNPHTHSCCSAW